MIENKDWITVPEAAYISGFHPYYLRELLRDGKIEALKFGTIWQVNRVSFMEYLEKANTSDDKRRGPKGSN